ncbi:MULTISPECIES: hypothetical protein [unclassified Streptomyces]
MGIILKKFITGLTIPVLALSLGLGATTSFASELDSPTSNNVVEQSQQITAEDIASLKEFLTSYNVDETTQDQLITKLKNGEVWDSIKQGQEPVNTVEKTTEENGVETISTFKDGSIAVTTLEPTIVEFTEKAPTTGGFSTFAVSPGTVTSGSGYKNFKKAKAYVYTGIANAHFYADFTIVQGGNDYISRVYDYKIVGIGGTASYDNLKITRKTENLNGKASAKLDFTWVAFNGATSSTCWIKLFVGKDSYSTDYSY